MWHRATVAFSGLDWNLHDVVGTLRPLAIMAGVSAGEGRARTGRALVMIWTSLAVFAASILFLAALSSLFDYGDPTSPPSGALTTRRRPSRCASSAWRAAALGQR